MENSLDDFIKRNSKFLKLGDEETVTVTYLGFVIGVDPKNPDKEKVTYKFKREGFENPVFLSSASTNFANRMNKIGKGEVIQLTRHGLDTATTYEINPA